MITLHSIKRHNTMNTRAYKADLDKRQQEMTERLRTEAPLSKGVGGYASIPRSGS